MAGTPRKRGRPPGAPSLTPERERIILSLIRKGVFDYVAAEAAGVSARAFREWVARGDGRSSRPPTPKLRAFAAKVAQAKAEARAVAEAAVHETEQRYWLSHAARSRAEREGWTEPAADDEEPAPTPEELSELLRGVRNALLYTDPTELVPRCPNRRCRCAWHRERTPAELECTRAIAARRTTPPGGTP